MPPSNSLWSSNTQGVTISNRLILDTVCPSNDCTFTYETLENSPSIESISHPYIIQGNGINVTLTGTRLNIGNNPQVVFVNSVTKSEQIFNVNQNN